MVTFNESCSVRVYDEDDHTDVEEALKEGPDPAVDKLRLLIKHLIKVRIMNKRQVLSFVGEELKSGVHARVQLALERLQASEATSVGSHVVRAGCEPMLEFLLRATE